MSHGDGTHLARQARLDWSLVAEFLLAAVIVTATVGIAWHFYQFRYLPQPFVYAVNGTFTDWFNTAYWAHHPGAYDVWRTVYPPFSFVFLKIFSFKACYDGPDAMAAANCDLLSIGSLMSFFVLNAILVYNCYRRLDPKTSLYRTIAVAFGLPMLYTLERGNLIIPCFTAFALGHGRLLRSARLRWLSIAASIGFKPYLVLATFAWAVRRRWRWIEGCALATVFLYIVSYAIMGTGDPLTLLANQQNWSQFVAPQYWWNIYYSTSYAPLLSAIHGPYPLLLYIGSRTLGTIEFVLTWLIRLGDLGVLACLMGVFFRPAAATMYRLASLCLLALMTASNPGGYTEVFLFFLVFMEPWRGPGRILALVAAYLLCIPADRILIPVFSSHQESWLGQRQVYAVFGLSIGQFVRPGLLLLMEYALVATTLRDIALAPAARASATSSSGRLATVIEA